MAYRLFKDERGIEWSVWDTRPIEPNVVAWMLGGGWLTFQCELGKLRLAPIPDGWDVADQNVLREMLGMAEPVIPTPPLPEHAWERRYQADPPHHRQDASS